MGSKALGIALLLLSSQVALADEQPLPDWDFKDPITAAPGVATAKITGKPSWCDAAGKIDTTDSISLILGHVDDKYGIQGVVNGALHMCRNPTEPTWRRYSERILQKWMNWTGESQADAEKSLRARIQTDKWDAQRTELCKALEVSPEASAEVATFGHARLQLFGCINQNQTLWEDTTQMNTIGVGYYLDGDLKTDELMRVFWLDGYMVQPYDGVTLPATTPNDNLPLLHYAIAQGDLAKLDVGALDKAMQAAPYNEYARIVLTETVSDLQRRAKLRDAAVDKLAKGDDDYTAILRTAPKKAWADWDKEVAQWRPELEHSEAFEKLWSAPSRKAMKGCAPVLLKDAEKVLKSLKATTYQEMIEKVTTDPVANLLFARLGVCAGYEKLGGAGVYQEIVNRGSHLRGPRSLAFAAISEAYLAAAKDRPKMVLTLTNLSEPSRAQGSGTNFDDHDFSGGGFLATDWGDNIVRGVVGSTKKTPEGTVISFKKTGFQFKNYECQDDLHHPLRIDDHGTIIYHQTCHNLPGVTKVDRTPDPVMIPSLLDGAVKPGVFVTVEELGASRAKSGEWLAVPMYTKKTATDAAITSFYGFSL